jgi:hypothetical protein
MCDVVAGEFSRGLEGEPAEKDYHTDDGETGRA